MPQLVVAARFVYVTTYDGPPWSRDVLVDDRQAVGDVEAALRSWGRYTLVYRPEEADIILVVQKRPKEDTLAVYRGKGGASSMRHWRGMEGTPSIPLEAASSIPLWRGMQEGGLDSKELPLMTRFRKAVEAAAAPKA